VREEDLDEAGLGVIVEGGLGDPDVIVGEGWTSGDFQKVEVGIEDTVGKHMLDMLTKKDGSRGDNSFRIDNPGFPETLPDVAWATAVDGCLPITADIYINKVAFADFEGLELDGEISDATCAEGLARLHQGAYSTIRRGWRTLNGTEVHDGLIVIRG
jgi:hypothetical protein